MTYRFALVATAALALTACGSKEPEATASSAPRAEESAPAASASAPAPSADAAPAAGVPAKDFVIGKWGNDGDCQMAIDLKADGTSDGPFGNWTYSDGVISFSEAPEMKFTVKVAADGKNMDSVNAQGGKHQMTRCP